MKIQYKMICIALIIIFPLLALSGCMNFGNKTIKIAVIEDPGRLYPGYKEGIERAVSDLNREYSDSGYNVECEFYSDNGRYEEGTAIIDTLVGDKSVTAVITTKNMEISKTAAYVFDNAGKLFIVPYFLYDSVYENNHYNTVFSMCNSADTVGRILRMAAAETTAKRWAVCASKSEFERAEMNGFIQYRADDDIQVVDCEDISALTERFDEVYSLWELLGVEGVVMFPTDREGFNILKNIKRNNPDIICAGDTAFDNSTLLDSDTELQKTMIGFIMANEFIMRDETDEEKNILKDMKEEYMQNTGNYFDVWYIQAYNAVRIIGDTAVKNKTCNPVRLARLLHENGYSGFCQDFKFNENGSQFADTYKYIEFIEDGYTEEHILKD